MNEVKLGQLIEGEAERDAIHIAVYPVVAGEDLCPGQRVRLDPDGKVYVETRSDYIGIVDPFLKGWVRQEQRCYIFLQPNTVSGMRHHWFHPDFDIPETSESGQWLHKFADEWCFSLESLIEEASYFGGCVVAGSDLYGKGELGADHDLFWHHLGIYLNRKFSEEHIDSITWRCSC